MVTSASVRSVSVSAARPRPRASARPAAAEISAPAARASVPGRRRPSGVAQRVDTRVARFCVASATANDDEPDDDVIADSVDRASKLLDLIIKETVEQIFVEEAVEEVIPGENDEDGEDSAPKLLKRSPDGQDCHPPRCHPAPSRRVGRKLPDGHLRIRSGGRILGRFRLLSLLAAIREEVISAVSGEMQPDIQVVQLVARLAKAEDRLEVLRAAHRGGKAAGFDVPAASIETVENTAARLVDEMENQEHVPSWQLLWQLLLVRETARQLHPNADDTGVYSTTVVNGSFSPSEIPRAEAAMIKELSVMNEAMRRRAEVMAKFDECRDLDEAATARDAEGGRIKLKRSSRGFSQPRGDDDDGSMDVFDVRDVRPGRLIDCVINMRVALTRDGADQRIVDRLTALYFESCDVVLEQADKGTKAMREDERARGELGDAPLMGRRGRDASAVPSPIARAHDVQTPSGTSL